MRAPTPPASHRRERSSVSPSDTSIIDCAPSRARTAASPMRAVGRMNRWTASRSAAPSPRCSAPSTRRRPAAAPPSDPVTTISSPGVAPGPKEGAAGGDLTHHRDRDREVGPTGEVAADEPQRMFVARFAHAAEQLHHPGGVHTIGQRERAQGVSRARGHRRDVAQGDGRSPWRRDHAPSSARFGSGCPRPSRRW